MAFIPNLGPRTRVIYMAAGAGLIVAALVGAFTDGTLPAALGAIWVFQGAAGF